MSYQSEKSGTEANNVNERNLVFGNSRLVSISSDPAVIVVTFDEDAKSAFEKAYSGWREYSAGIPAGSLSDEVYAAFYWLFRYSGLVSPASEDASS